MMCRKISRVIFGVMFLLSASIAKAEWGVDVLDLDTDQLEAGPPDPVFVDVLDAPAVKSKLASKSLLNGITRAGSRLVAVGNRGHILYSDNQGKTWTQASVPASSDLVAVSFPTPQKGWAVGHDGLILHSSDSGVTWVKQFDGRAALQVMGNRYTVGTPGIAEEVTRLVSQGPDKPFLDVWFDNETTGYVVGAFNFIFRTTDGGRVWEPWYEHTENPKRLHMYTIRRIGQDLYIAGEQGLVLKYDPQTEKFRALKSQYNGTFFGLTGKPGVLIAFGLRGNAFRSLNGGTSWQKIETAVPASLTGGTVTSDGHIVLVTLLGNILVSDDDGANFKQITQSHSLPAAAVTETDNGNLALVGIMGAWRQGYK